MIRKFTELSPAPSKISLGTCAYGSSIPEDQALRVFDAYFEAGGNFIDTAHVYSAWEENGEGTAERCTGAWIRKNGVRDKIVISTKGGHPPLNDYTVGRCSHGELNRDLNESLERLGVDRVDLYWLHRDDISRPVDEIMDTLDSFVQDGRIRCYGASNWSTARMSAANAYAETRGIAPFAGSQPGWAFADRIENMPPPDRTMQFNDAIREWHKKTGMPVMPFTAQAKGYFGDENAAWAKDGFSGAPPCGERFESPGNRQRLLRAIEMAEKKGVTANQIALAWLMNHPFAVYPIIGTSRPERIAAVMPACDVALTEEEVEWLYKE